MSGLKTAAEEHNTLGAYVAGYALSLVLTIGAYLFVRHHTASKDALVVGVAVLARTQFFVQLFFFLRLGRETRPRWKLLTFGFMVLVVMILVLGSLWIMSNLNSRMSPQQMNNYLKNQDSL